MEYVKIAILKAAQESGYFEGEIPDNNKERGELAEYWYNEALRAWDTGMREDSIEAIIRAGDPDFSPDPRPADRQAESSQEEEVETEDAVAKTYPRRSSGGLSESDEREADGAPDPSHPLAAFIGKENLPIPPEVEGDAHEMPRDLTALDDKKIRLLHGEYGAFLSRAKWLLAVASSDVASATHLREAAFRVALQSVVRVDDETKKAKLAGVIEAEAKEDSQYAKFDLQVQQHTARQTAFKALVDIYGGNVDRLSREWTMRQDEYNKSR